MKKVLLSSILLFSFLAVIYAQKDPVAGKLLDQFSEKALSAPSVTMAFELTFTDAVEQTEETITGTAIIRKGSYKLLLPENSIWYNGEAIWTYSPEVNEVTITVPDPGDDTFVSDPESLFTMYREGYKYKLVEEKGNGNLVDLYPEDLNAEFSRIRLLISKSGDLSEAEYKRKDGITIFVKVKSYDLKKEYPASFFLFNPGDFPDVEIIDMR
ncbi:MAG: outer membrane lipoprotein carrier protein LolA [Bacteroidales bacterium]